MTLEDFPIARPVNTDKWDLQAYAPQNIIGMDSGSTVLEALKNAGRIASKSFGFWWGLDGVGEKDQKGGSFVLGGYDRAKAYGDGVTTQLTHTDKCASGMVVSISDILLNFRNGTDTSIYNLQVAIENGEVARSMGIDFWNVVLSPDFKM
jgi:hypothetical protein